MKKFIMIFTISVLLFYTGFVYLNNDLNVTPSENVSVISPFPEKLNRTVKLYFIYEEQLHFESRNIKYENNNIFDEIAKQLKLGPKVKKYSAGISDKVDILSINVENRVCYVNLTSQFAIEVIGDNDRGLLNVWSIVNTLCDLREVDSVLILSNGERLNIEIGGFYLGENLFSNNNYTYQADSGPTEFVDNYLNKINESRFDLAYEMLDVTSRDYISYESFLEDMERYISTYSEFRRGIQFSQKREETVYVYVKYIKVQINESVQDSPVFKRYQVIKEDDEWKIKYVQIEQ